MMRGDLRVLACSFQSLIGALYIESLSLLSPMYFRHICLPLNYLCVHYTINFFLTQEEVPKLNLLTLPLFNRYDC